MLIEFSVQNFRSFREKQTFSMVASAKMARDRPDLVIKTGFSAVPHALRSACIFGANGAGKSSLVSAMGFVAKFVRYSFGREAGSPLQVKPFRFHSKWRDQPSEFEVVFIHEETMYQYGFVLSRERVEEEWLFARPKETGRERLLFTRTYDHTTKDYDWQLKSTHLKGKRDSWKSQTRPDALFLTTAVQLNAESLEGAHHWLSRYFRALSTSPETLSHEDYTSSRFKENNWKGSVIDFLRRTDIPLHDIEVEEKELFELQDFASLPEPLQKGILKNRPDAKFFVVNFFREDNQQLLIPLPLGEESTGTKSLFELAGPILDVLDYGLTVSVDEMNSGLHPLAFQHLVTMFHNPKINQNNAQLIFTTHDTSVTDSNYMQRDQIWLVEKTRDYVSHLIPFSDFKTRDHDARSFQKGYLQGRYGAVPHIQE